MFSWINLLLRLVFSGWCFVCDYCYWFWLLVVYLIAGLDGCLVSVFGLLASVFGSGLLLVLLLVWV